MSEELTKEEKKAKRKEKVKKGLKVVGLVTSGVIFGGISTFIGQKIYQKKHEDPDNITLTKDQLVDCALEVEKNTFFHMLSTASKLCNENGGEAMIARDDHDPENPKYLMAKLVDEIPEGYDEKNFIEPEDLHIFDSY